jgi:hypothetical protein
VGGIPGFPFSAFTLGRDHRRTRPGCRVRSVGAGLGPGRAPGAAIKRKGKRARSGDDHHTGGLTTPQPVLQPGREHALPGWVGDSESMGGRGIVAGGGGPHMAATDRGRRTYPQDR